MGGNAKSVVSVDVNEDNVRVKVVDKAYILETNVKSFTIDYAKYREVAQSINGHVKGHSREGADIRFSLKIAKLHMHQR
jgi:hypothetical protein